MLYFAFFHIYLVITQEPQIILVMQACSYGRVSKDQERMVARTVGAAGVVEAGDVLVDSPSGPLAWLRRVTCWLSSAASSATVASSLRCRRACEECATRAGHSSATESLDSRHASRNISTALWGGECGGRASVNKLMQETS